MTTDITSLGLEALARKAIAVDRRIREEMDAVREADKNYAGRSSGVWITALAKGDMTNEEYREMCEQLSEAVTRAVQTRDRSINEIDAIYSELNRREAEYLDATKR